MRVEDQRAMAFRDDGVDDEAEVFRSVYPALYRLACVVCPPEGDPDDLVQEAVVRALRRGSLLDLDAPRAYLSRAVVNLAANERRRLGRLRAAIDRLRAEPRAIVPSYPSDVGLLFDVEPRDRAVLWMADVERLPLGEVAEVLGCSHDAARARASRARRELRRRLGEEEQ